MTGVLEFRAVIMLNIDENIVQFCTIALLLIPCMSLYHATTNNH